MRRGFQKRVSIGCACLAAVLTALPALAGRPPATERRFTFTYAVRVPAVRGRKLRLWVPLPRDDHYQTISRLRIVSPVPARIERSQEGNREAYFTLSGARLTRPTEILIRFTALRLEHVVRLRDPAPQKLPPASLAFYLRPDRMIPLNGVIAEISREQARGLTGHLAKARRFYRYVLTHMRYDKSGTGWGRGDAVWACSSHRGNCTDFHSLFIGLARAAGIPARFRIGFPLPPKRSAGRIPGYHCWAEFYLQGVGWVPVDAADAWLDPQRRKFYFGGLGADRIFFTAGRDLRLNPPQKGQSLNYFIYPYAELDGKIFKGVKSEFYFHDLNR
jgi:transglutaminase-like putative cysteine protease